MKFEAKAWHEPKARLASGKRRAVIGRAVNWVRDTVGYFLPNQKSFLVITDPNFNILQLIDLIKQSAGILQHYKTNIFDIRGFRASVAFLPQFQFHLGACLFSRNGIFRQFSRLRRDGGRAEGREED